MRQGDVYWIEFRGEGSEAKGRRPAVVVQGDVFNRSRLQTAVLAAITSNLRLAEMPGNVRLRRGEGNLPRDCVINVTHLHAVDRSRLTQPIGSLGVDRIAQLRRGLALLMSIRPEDLEA